MQAESFGVDGLLSAYSHESFVSNEIASSKLKALEERDPVTHLLAYARDEFKYKLSNTLIYFYKLLSRAEHISEYRMKYSGESMYQTETHFCRINACHPLSLIGCHKFATDDAIDALIRESKNIECESLYICRFGKLHICNQDVCKHISYDHYSMANVCTISGNHYASYEAVREAYVTEDGESKPPLPKWRKFDPKKASMYKKKSSRDDIKGVKRGTGKKRTRKDKNEQEAAGSDAPLFADMFDIPDDVSEMVMKFAKKKQPRPSHGWDDDTYSNAHIEDYQDMQDMPLPGLDITETELRNSANHSSLSRVLLRTMIASGAIRPQDEDMKYFPLSDTKKPGVKTEESRSKMSNERKLVSIRPIYLSLMDSPEEWLSLINSILKFDVSEFKEPNTPDIHQCYLSDLRTYIGYHCNYIMSKIMHQNATIEIDSKPKEQPNAYKGVTIIEGYKTRKKRRATAVGGRTDGDRKNRRQRTERHHNLGIDQPSSTNSGSARSGSYTSKKPSKIEEHEKNFNSTMALIDRLPNWQSITLEGIGNTIKQRLETNKDNHEYFSGTPEWCNYTYQQLYKTVALRNNTDPEPKRKTKIPEEIEYMYFYKTEPFLSIIKSTENGADLGPRHPEYAILLSEIRGEEFGEFLQVAFSVIYSLCPGPYRHKIELQSIKDACREKNRALKQRLRDLRDQSIYPSYVDAANDCEFNPMRYPHILHVMITEMEAYRYIDVMYHVWKVCKRSPYMKKHEIQALKMREHCAAVLYFMTKGLRIPPGIVVIPIQPLLKQRGYLVNPNSVGKYFYNRKTIGATKEVIKKCIFSVVALEPAYNIAYYSSFKENACIDPETVLL